MRSETSRAKCVPKLKFGNENYVPGRTRVKAYYGMMTAMMNYFGKAFSVKSPQGEELLRFVENGNVLMMKENLSIDRSVHQMANFTALGLPASGGKQFIIRNTILFLTSQASDHTKANHRTRQGAWGLLDGGAAVQMAMGKRWTIKNKNGMEVMSVDTYGNFIIDGKMVDEQDPDDLLGIAAEGNKFGIKAAGDFVALLDPEWGGVSGDDPFDPQAAGWPTLYLKGTFEHYVSQLNPPANSLRINNATETVAYFDADGNFKCKGRAFFGQNPDPRAHRSVFLFADDFAEGETAWPHPVDNHSLKYYTTTPTLTANPSGAWEIHDDGAPHAEVLRNKALSSEEAVSIPQTFADVDYDLCFKFPETQTPYSTAKINVRENDTEAVYVKITPPSSISLMKHDESTNPPPPDAIIYEKIITTVHDPAFPKDAPTPHNLNPMQADLWYELHVQCRDDVVRVWLRERDTVAPSGQGLLWARVIEEGDYAASPVKPTITGSPLRFSVAVQRQSVASIWSFDDLIVNTFLPGIPNIY